MRIYQKRRPINWEIIALLSFGFLAKDIMKMGYSSTAYKYQECVIEAKLKALNHIVLMIKELNEIKQELKRVKKELRKNKRMMRKFGK